MSLEAVDPPTRAASATGTATPQSPPDALSVLMDSQDAVRRLMQRFEALSTLPSLSTLISTPQGRSLRNRLVRRLCLEMAVQLQIEEELLFPSLRQALDDPALIDHAQAVQRRLRRWITGLLDLDIDDPAVDDPATQRRVRSIALLFERHLRHEVFDVHRLVQKTRLDWQDLGQRIQHRRDELLAAAVRPDKSPHRPTTWPH